VYADHVESTCHPYQPLGPCKGLKDPESPDSRARGREEPHSPSGRPNMARPSRRSVNLRSWEWNRAAHRRELQACRRHTGNTAENSNEWGSKFLSLWMRRQVTNLDLSAPFRCHECGPRWKTRLGSGDLEHPAPRCRPRLSVKGEVFEPVLRSSGTWESSEPIRTGPTRLGHASG